MMRWQSLACRHGTVALIATVLCTAIAEHAMAEEAIPAGYYVSLSADADDADSSNVDGAFGLPLGERGWLHLGAGSSSTSLDAVSVDTTALSIAGGIDTDSLSVSGSYAWRKDSDSFQQNDLSARMTFVMSRGTFGLDVFHRSSEDEDIASLERRRRDPVAVRITESVEGWGYGAHASLRAGDFTLFASGMQYDYEVDTEQPPLLLRFPRLELRLSGVTRGVAYFDNSMMAGVTWDSAPCSITFTYLRDQTLDSEEITDSVELTADIPIGEHWSVAPRLGQSSNDTDGDVIYGGVSVSVFW